MKTSDVLTKGLELLTAGFYTGALLEYREDSGLDLGTTGPCYCSLGALSHAEVQDAFPRLEDIAPGAVRLLAHTIRQRHPDFTRMYHGRPDFELVYHFNDRYMEHDYGTAPDDVRGVFEAAIATAIECGE